MRLVEQQNINRNNKLIKKIDSDHLRSPFMLSVFYKIIVITMEIKFRQQTNRIINSGRNFSNSHSRYAFTCGIFLF